MSETPRTTPSPAAPWDLNVEAGDPADIFGRPYIFERVDSDSAVTFRAPTGSDGGDFLVVDAEGRLRKPTTGEVLALMEDDDLIWRDRPLGKDARRHARANQHDAEQAHAMDPLSEFRMAIVRRYDECPWSKSDASLRAFMKEALAAPKIAALPGAWAACPATVRTWLNDRGTQGCRKERDGISMKNRMPPTRKIKHPLEIVFYHVARATNVRGSVQMNYDKYVAEIATINAGEKLIRKQFDFDNGCFTEEPAEYDVPRTPYVGIPYNRFWRLCHHLQSERAYGRKTTAQAAMQRYGGGGLGDLPTHVGALCWIDAKAIEKAFFVDDVTAIPIGTGTLTLMEEHASKVAVGWDLCPGACNSSAILRTVLKANQVKQVPERLLKIDPNLPYLRLRPDKIRFDNSTEAHGRTVEQNLTDAYIGTEFVGSRMPRDKNVMERILGTFQTLLFKHQVDANYDIARMRLYGFDPETKGHFLCSIQTARRLLDLAAMTYNATRNRGLDRRQPGLVWKQKLGTRKLNVLKSVDEFRDGIGIVDKVTMSNTGFEKFNRRFTAGALDMRRIFQDFERAERTPKGDIAPKPRKNRDDRKRATFEVRIRYDEDDIGIIKVWNPHNPSGAKWERFGCTEPGAHGMPLWLHKRCLELAEREAMDYLTPEGQSVVRAKLFEEIANVDSQAAERERQTLGLALADPHLRQVMSTYVEVVDEDAADFPDPDPEEHEPAKHGLSTGRRQDADIDTPRQKATDAKQPVTMRRRGQPPAQDAAELAVKGAAAPARRRTSNRKPKNDDRRNATSHTKSAHQPDQRAPSRTRSNHLRWGDVF